ncbi:MAG: hypothetical protein V3V14_10040 [Saprospiraceae bacterium]
MKNYFYYLLLLAAIVSCKNNSTQSNPDTTDTTKLDITRPADDRGPVQSIKLSPKWMSDSILITSESLIYDDKTSNYYVSCINGVPPTKKDGDGFIAIIDSRGNIVNSKWLSGLNAPKGIVIKGNQIIVTDIDELVIINKSKGEIEKRLLIPGAKFLNDIALAPDGSLYFTDSSTNTIYRYSDDKVTLYKRDKNFGGCNGIFVDHETIHVVGFDSGDISSIDIDSKKVTNHGKSIVPGGDGIAPWQGGFIMSNWNGEVYYIDALYKATKVLDTKDLEINAADIVVNSKTNEILIATFFDNRVVSYGIEDVFK